MATETDHIALANRNHDALVHLIPDVDRFSEWIATIAFYKAVQIVEAAFSNDSSLGTTSSHRDRKLKLKSHRKFNHVFVHYRVLWQASTIARYLEDHETGRHYRQFADYLSPQDVVKELVQHRLHQVEKTVRKNKLLSDAAIRTLSFIGR